MMFATDDLCIWIEGKRYTLEKAVRGKGGKSPLQMLFDEKYGACSFQVSLADFLADWFSDEPEIKIRTSGSTGRPKEMSVSKRRMVNSARMTVDFLGLKKGDAALLCMPLSYIAGKMVVVRSLIAGMDMLPVVPGGHPLADLDRVPDFAAMIPMQVFNSFQIPKEREMLSQIRQLIIGGGAIDPELVAELQHLPNNVWSTYGMTETLSHVALRRLNGKDASFWYRPMDSVRLSEGPDHRLVIDAPLLHPGVLVTNDIVEFNASGEFRMLGRADNVINTGGIKVQIEEVEVALGKLLPDEEFMITSVPDRKFGEAVVLLLAGSENDRIRDAIRLLPAYWRPKRVVAVRSLPYTGSGKFNRAEARKMALAAAAASGNRHPENKSEK